MTDPVGPSDVEDVEVIGERFRRYVDPAVGIGVVVYSVWTGSGYVEFSPLNPDLIDSLFDGTTEILENTTQPTVRINPAILKTDPQYPALIEKSLQLALRINQIDPLIRNMSSQDTLFLPLNNQISVPGAQSLWFRMNYVVTLTNYGNGRGGEVVIDAMTGIATSSVNVGTLTDYISGGGEEGGLNYYLLHEWAHTTAANLGFNQSQFNLYYNRMQNAGTPDPTGQFFYTSPEGILAEQYANYTALTFANLGPIPLWPTPPYGYTFP